MHNNYPKLCSVISFKNVCFAIWSIGFWIFINQGSVYASKINKANKKIAFLTAQYKFHNIQLGWFIDTVCKCIFLLPYQSFTWTWFFVSKRFFFENASHDGRGGEGWVEVKISLSKRGNTQALFPKKGSTKR